ncbi:MAG: F0F1 ATP synthase subunit B [Ancalomicrobiaceae bacterium]|nr:F0F1 ATP synthase subunit B [Ancalomicrobiaceae bacterium]
MADTTQVPAGEATAPQTGTEVGHNPPAHEGSGFPPFDTSTFASQLLWLAIAFGVLFVLMSRVALPRIADVIDAPKDKIAKDVAEAGRLKAETDAAIAAYEAALAEARQKAGAIAAETHKALSAEVEAKRHAAEAALSDKLAAAEAQIGEIKARALQEVGGIARDTAEAVLGILTPVPVSTDEIAAAVDAETNR